MPCRISAIEALRLAATCEQACIPRPRYGANRSPTRPTLTMQRRLDKLRAGKGYERWEDAVDEVFPCLEAALDKTRDTHLAAGALMRAMIALGRRTPNA